MMAADSFKQSHAQSASRIVDVVEFSLTYVQENHRPQQACLYLPDSHQKALHLEFCQGSSSLALVDRISLSEGEGSLANNPSYLAVVFRAVKNQKPALEQGQMAKEVWLRMALPLLHKRDAKRFFLGLLVLDFIPGNFCPKRSVLKTLSNQVSEVLYEIQSLEKWRLHQDTYLQKAGPYDRRHIEIRLVEALAYEMGLGKREIDEIKIAAFLEGSDTPDQEGPRKITHSLPSPPLPQGVKMTLHHLYEIDQELKSNQDNAPPANSPCMAARILAVTNAYCSLRRGEIGGEICSIREALEILRTSSGKRFDSQVVSSLPMALIRSRCKL